MAPCEKGKKLTTMHNAISSAYIECRLIVPPPRLNANKGLLDFGNNRYYSH